MKSLSIPVGIAVAMMVWLAPIVSAQDGTTRGLTASQATTIRNADPRNYGSVYASFGAPTKATANQDATLYTTYASQIAQTSSVNPLGSDLFGEQIDLYDGGLSFRVVDVSVPGVGDLPFEVARTYSVRAHNDRPRNDRAFADWDLDLPRLTLEGSEASTISRSTPRCSQGLPSGGPYFVQGTEPLANGVVVPTRYEITDADHWTGWRASIPGGGQLLRNPVGQQPLNLTSPQWRTKGNAWFSCLPSIANGTNVGEGFLAIDARGTKYWFNHQAVNVRNTLRVFVTQVPRYAIELYPTRIEDRHGNAVTYTYSNSPYEPVRLTAMRASDDRQIDITYLDSTFPGAPTKHIHTVRSGARTWTYGYSGLNDRWPSLSSVGLPDGTAWDIEFSPKPGGLLTASGFNQIRLTYGPLPSTSRLCDGPPPLLPGVYSGIIRHPSGAAALYQVTTTRFGRSRVAQDCLLRKTWPGSSSVPPGVNIEHHRTNRHAVRYDKPAITARMNFDGVTNLLLGLVDGTRTAYSYSSTCVGFDSLPVSTSCPVSGGVNRTRVETQKGVQLPDNKVGYNLDVDETFEFSNAFGSGEGALLSHVIKNVGGDVLQQRTSEFAVFGVRWGDSLLPQVAADAERSRVTTRVSETRGSLTLSTATSLADHDQFARPVVRNVTSNETISWQEVHEYHDDFSRWVLGQPKRMVVDGTETKRIEYDEFARPRVDFSFGDFVQSRGYNADGTLAWVADGNNNVTQLQQWRRGVPRLIIYADQTSQSALVSDEGWITSVSDQSGAVTGYKRDVMGRLEQVTYPAGDPVAWAPSVFGWQRATTSVYGISRGHWQWTQTEGGRVRRSYLDQLFRPLVEEVYDAARPAETRSIVVKRYDHLGRLAFESKPRRSINSVDDPALPGITYGYDVLGRMTSRNDAGRLTTFTYLLNGQRRTVNARDQATLETFRMYGSHSYDLPTKIEMPEGVTIDITRQRFGWPQRIRRSGGGVELQRDYVYSLSGLLCRQSDPETGVTFFSYDGNRNVKWSYAVPSSLVKGCPGSSHGVGQRTIRSYDAFNRLTGVDYPDTTVDVSYGYTPTGQLKRAEAGGNVRTYEYNRRGMPTVDTYTYPNAGDYTHRWEYDALGNLSAETTISGMRLDYAPNALGQASQAGSFATNATYDEAGRLAGFTYGNGMSRSITYNLWGEPLNLRDIGGPGIDLTYGYDGAGNITGITDNAGGVLTRNGFSYDGLDRLRAVNNPGGFGASSFTYDSLDNLRSSTNAGNALTYNYDISKNQLSTITNSAGGVVNTLGYDALGNVTTNNARQHRFDLANRMTEVVGVARYEYDAHGRRTVTWRQDGTGKIDVYTQDGVLRYTSDNALAGGRTHIYLAGVPVAEQFRRWDGTGTTNLRYLHTDALRSVVAGTGASREVLLSPRVYQPYGKTPQTLWDRAGYTYHMEDRYTDLVYMQQRYYDPAIGRFLSVDPVGPLENPINHFGRYHYANNNPYRFVDPDGRESVGQMIDRNATSSASEGRDAATYGWALAGVAWSVFGAENISLAADGQTSSSGGVALEAAQVIPFVRLGRYVAAGGEVVTAARGIGFARGAAESALSGMRGGGGHAIRKLEGVFIPNGGSLQSRVDAFKALATPILENPIHAANWRIGATQGRAFLGSVDGQHVVVVVAKDGPYQGKVISSFIPDSNQLDLILSR